MNLKGKVVHKDVGDQTNYAKQLQVSKQLRVTWKDNTC